MARFVHVALGLALVGCGGTPAPTFEPAPPAPTPDEEPAVDDTSATADESTDAETEPEPDPEPPRFFSARVSIVDGAAQLVPGFPCEEGSCDGTPLDLGPATSARIEYVVDLLGALPMPVRDPLEAALEQAGQDPVATARPRPVRNPAADSGFPAVVVVVTHERRGGYETRTMLVSLRDSTASTIWSEVTDARSARGGGVGSRDFAFRHFEDGQPFEITFRGEALPSRGDRPMRPGPPLYFQFRYDAGADEYRRYQP